MNKTFTAALAISAISSLALADRTPATVDTPPAGYEDVTPSKSMFVINPFGPFGDSLTLGSIDGSFTTNTMLRVLGPTGKKIFDVKWNGDSGWCEYANSAFGTARNSYPLQRGHSVMFIKPTQTETITVAGVLNTIGESVPCVQGQNYVGNVAPEGKYLSDFVISGNFDPLTDYVVIGNPGTKYVYDSGNWYTRENFLDFSADLDALDDDEVPIGVGEGFRVYTPKGAGAVISLPGL